MCFEFSLQNFSTALFCKDRSQHFTHPLIPYSVIEFNIEVKLLVLAFFFYTSIKTLINVIYVPDAHFFSFITTQSYAARNRFSFLLKCQSMLDKSLSKEPFCSIMAKRLAKQNKTKWSGRRREIRAWEQRNVYFKPQPRCAAGAAVSFFFSR